MTRDTCTLPLFAGELLPTSPPPATLSLPAHWPPARRDNFTWWCQYGNKEMCAAVLWRNEGFTQADATALVKALESSHGGLFTEACAA